jgi:hypothetical protein
MAGRRRAPLVKKKICVLDLPAGTATTCFKFDVLNSFLLYQCAEVGKNIFVLLFIFIVIIYLFILDLQNGNMSIARTAKYQLFEILFVFGGVHSGGGKAPNWGYKTRETPTNCGGVRSGEATCSCGQLFRGQSSRIHQRTEVGSS